MANKSIRDMSWRTVFTKCLANPNWAANQIISQDNELSDLQTELVNMVSDLMPGGRDLPSPQMKKDMYPENIEVLLATQAEIAKLQDILDGKE